MFDRLREKLSRSTDESETESEDVETETDESQSQPTTSSADEENHTIDSETDSTDGDGSDAGSVSKTERAKTFLSGKRVLDADELETHLEEFRMTLLQNNVAMSVADEITALVKDDLSGEKERLGKSSAARVHEALKDSIVEVVSRGQDTGFIEKVESAEKPFVVMFTGVNGVGKTTSIAKVSQRLENEGYSSVIANGDTYRAGAREQVRTHAEALDTKLISHEQGSDPTAVLYDAVEYAEANDIDVVLCDTAGRLHTSEDLMTQLEKMERVVGPDMTIFVDEAVAGQDAINRAQEFSDAATVDGLILTKSDADESGGAILSLPYLLEKPIYYLGVGQEYEDLARFTPEDIATALLEERTD